MGFWSSLFGEEDPQKPARPAASRHLPSTMVAREFGEVNVKRAGGETEVRFTILMEPIGAEGWQTGVALDASGSMMPAFGKGLTHGPKGDPPASLLAEYKKKDWLDEYPQPGGKVHRLYSMEAKADLVARGHSVWTKNEVEPLAREATAYLASKLDADGGTTVIYWACGDGNGIEVVGDLTAEQCKTAHFGGPKSVEFGASTHLLPAMKYFAERFKDAENGMYLFITDGELNDLSQVKAYTVGLCREIAASQRHPLKCVLIGVGDAINEKQMEELDDLDSGTEVDIWDHKIAREMRGLVEIFAEVVSEHAIVAPSAKIYDAAGNVVADFPKGLPGKVTFTMPASSGFFELEVNGQRVRQPVA
ncbi:MAG: vWA domain-containing protein [Gemmataceae bacterium]